MRLSLEPSPEEEKAAYAWIEADPRHAVAFARAEAAWDNADRLKGSGKDEIKAADASVKAARAARASSRQMLAMATAALLIFLVAAGVTIRTFNDITKYSTRIGEVKDVTLADGSRIHLNSGTSVEVRYTDHGRMVHILKGEACFDVAHDRSRPFDVEAESASIRALGTTFNVRMHPSMVELTVTEGTVQVRSGSAAQNHVSAGSAALIRPRAIVLTHPGKQIIDQRLAWRQRMVELDGETIEQAVAEFNRYRTQPLLIGDTRVSSLRIDGRFRTTEGREFLAALQVSLPIRAIKAPDGSIMLVYRDDPARR